MDAETYSIMRKVCAPKKPKETDLKEIITKMENYVKPKVNETVLRQQFREWKQKQDKSVIQYIASLRNLARDCKFKEEEEAIRDQIITGIKSRAIKIALFKEEKLTLSEAIKTATAIEGATTAAENVEAPITTKGIEEKEEDVDTHRIQTWSRYRRGGAAAEQRKGPRTNERERKGQPNSSRFCLCCGKPNHSKGDCRHKSKSCYKCGKQGHLRRVCTAQANVKRNVKNVEAESDDTGSDGVSEIKPLILGNNRINRIEPQYLQITIGNKSLAMEVDGGSAVSLISNRERKKYFPECKLEETPVTLSYYSGEKSKPKGILRGIKINYGTITTEADLYVVGDKGRPLIGRDWLHA